MSNIGKLIFDSYLVSHGRVQICWWVKKVSKTIRKTNVFPTIKHLFGVISLWCLIAGLNDFPPQDNLYFSFNQFDAGHLQFNRVSSSTFCKNLAQLCSWIVGKVKVLTPRFVPFICSFFAKSDVVVVITDQG